jgi:hypothetical protein
MILDDDAKNRWVKDQTIQAAAIFVFVTSFVILLVSFFTDKIDSFTLVISIPIQIAAVFAASYWPIE